MKKGWAHGHIDTRKLESVALGSLMGKPQHLKLSLFTIYS